MTDASARPAGAPRMADLPAAFHRWVEALEARHLRDLRVQEVTRALRALSSAYVQRRHKVASGGALDSAGKRAAFALFYGPLHYLVVHHVLAAAGARARPESIVDLGCGTGAAGAAWAAARPDRPARVLGIDRHPWALAEARWTYAALGLDGRTRTGDLTRLPRMEAGSGIIAGYVLNELASDRRTHVLDALVRAAQDGASFLVVEPIARSITPWWDEAARLVTGVGGRADEWKIAVDLPGPVARFARAAGLDHRELKARTLMMRI